MEALSSPPKVAADQNPFPLLPPSSRMSREKDLPMLNLGRAPRDPIAVTSARVRTPRRSRVVPLERFTHGGDNGLTECLSSVDPIAGLSVG